MPSRSTAGGVGRVRRLDAVPRCALAAALAALALTAVAPSDAGTRESTACQLPAGGTEREQLAATVVALVNEHRSRLGLRLLRPAPTLELAARWKARHMARYRYLSHWDAGAASRSPGERLQACGYRGASWGENIAAGFRSARGVMTGWLASPGHRANIEDPAWRRVGVAAVQSRDGTLYWVQEFGQ